jgi:RNA polymerase-binding transcription factor DksA
MEHFRRQLREIAARITGEVGELRDEALRPLGADISGARAADPEAAVEAGGQEAAVGVLRSEEAVLGEVRAALDRLDRGTFGACETCGRPIGRSRLDALPYARSCTRCAKASG